MGRSHLLCALALALLFAPSVAEACDCAQASEPFDALVEAQEVFEAEVLGRAGGQNWGIKVLRSWKGSGTKDDSPLHNDQWCGASLRVGERYLFYTDAGAKGPRNVSMCSRVVAAKDMADDLAELGPAPDLRDPSQRVRSAPTAPPVKPASYPIPTRGCLNCTVSSSSDSPFLGLWLLLLVVAKLRRARLSGKS